MNHKTEYLRFKIVCEFNRLQLNLHEILKSKWSLIILSQLCERNL